MSSPRLITILTPTRNEARSAPLVMAEIATARQQLAERGWDVELFVIDDQSTDQTAEVIKREADLRGVPVTIVDGPGSGLSRALTAGLTRVLERNPDLIATFDFDGQHDASQFPMLVDAFERSNNVDVVFGSRFATGASVTGVQGFRKLVSRAAQVTIRLASAGPRVPSDATTSLRIFTPRVAQGFLDEVPSVGLDGYRLFSWFAVFTSCRFRFAEVPIDFRPRLNGVSKLTLKDMVSFARGLRTVRHMSKDWLRQENEAELFPEYPNAYLSDLGELERYNDWIVSTIAPHLAGRVADVGAGTGTFVGAISALPAVGSITAFEPDPLRYASLVAAVADSPTVTNVNGTLADSTGVFDSVLYCNSLEHIPSVLSELRLAAEKCSPGGSVVIFGPAMELIYGEVDRMSGHYRRFTIPRLVHSVEEAGFTVTHATYGDPVGAILYGVSNRVLNDGSLRTRFLGLYERVVLPISRLVTPLTRRVGGKNIILVAKLAPVGTSPHA